MGQKLQKLEGCMFYNPERVSSFLHFNKALNRQPFCLITFVHLHENTIAYVLWVKILDLFIIYNTVHIEILYPVFPPSSSSLVFSEFITLFSFFHFILRFWNQIFICRSVRQRACEISILRLLVKYLLKWNSFSNSRV